MTFTNKKMKDINSIIDEYQRLLSELPHLKYMDRESEFNFELLEPAWARDFLNHHKDRLMELYTVDYVTPEELAKNGYTKESWALEKERRRKIPKNEWLDKIYNERLLLSIISPEFKQFKEHMPDLQQLKEYRKRFDMTQRAALHLPEHYEQEEQIEM